MNNDPFKVNMPLDTRKTLQGWSSFPDLTHWGLSQTSQQSSQKVPQNSVMNTLGNVYNSNAVQGGLAVAQVPIDIATAGLTKLAQPLPTNGLLGGLKKYGPMVGGLAAGFLDPEGEVGALGDLAKGEKVVKDLQPLTQEALKYKSAEEFVKAQEPVYHGSPVPLKSFSNKKGGVFFTDSMENASGFGGNPDNVYEGYLNFKKPLVIDAKGAKWDELNTKYGTTTQQVIANAQKDGFDGVTFKNIVDNVGDTADWGGTSTVHYAYKPKDAFLNESQLTDLYNKVTKK